MIERTIEKAKILEDYKFRVNRELDGVEKRLETLKKQNYVLNEISHLIDEESFFTETGFLKSVKKKDSSKIEENEENSTKTSIKDDDTDDSNEITNQEQNESLIAENETGTQTVTSSQVPTNTNTQNNTENSNIARESTEEISTDSIRNEETNILNLSKNMKIDDPKDTDSTIEPTTGLHNENMDTSDDKRERLYSDVAEPKETSISKSNTKNINSEIEALEKERKLLKKLILEIENRRSSLKSEASRLRILKKK